MTPADSPQDLPAPFLRRLEQDFAALLGKTPAPLVPLPPENPDV